MSPRDGSAAEAWPEAPPVGAEAPRILMTPDYRRDNPYQALLATALEDRGARVAFARGYRRMLPLRRMLGQDGGRPDVLHLHWLDTYLKGGSRTARAFYAAKLVLDAALVRRAGVRLAWTVHNLVGHEQVQPALELWCRRRLARLADAVIVHAEEARDLVVEAYRVPAEKVFVIPHGHYRAVYGAPVPAAEARRRLGLSEAGRVFLFFGMIRPYKGVPELVSAWAGAPELNRGNALVIAGEARDPAYREEIRRLAAGAPGTRLFLGRVPDDEVATYFSAADVVVLPFERALTSGSLVLAQQFGRRVVARNVPGLPEGCRVGPGHSLAGAMIAALSDVPARPPKLPEWPVIAGMTLEAFR